MKPYSILVLITVLAFSNCVPTSVLTSTKDSSGRINFKVKRSSNEKVAGTVENKKNSNEINGQSIATSAPIDNNLKKISNTIKNLNDKLNLKNDNDINGQNIPEPIVAGLFMNSNSIKEKPAPHKRGINSQFLYGNPSNNDLPLLTRNYPNYIPNGVWGNELDPIPSMDFQDFDDYQRVHYKPYDNLQNLLNSEPSDVTGTAQYQNQISLPYQYSPAYGYNRYYNERKKRSNKQHSTFDDTIPEYTELELTPNELLALLAMIEAGALENQNQEPQSQWDQLNNKDYLSAINKPNYYDDNDEIGSYLTQNKLQENDFDPRYQIPVNYDNSPLYEPYQDKKKPKTNNGGWQKRFMVSKKKRSPQHYMDGPLGKPGISFSPMKGAKSIHKVI